MCDSAEVRDMIYGILENYENRFMSIALRSVCELDDFSLVRIENSDVGECPCDKFQVGFPIIVGDRENDVVRGASDNMSFTINNRVFACDGNSDGSVPVKYDEEQYERYNFSIVDTDQYDVSTYRISHLAREYPKELQYIAGEKAVIKYVVDVSFLKNEERVHVDFEEYVVLKDGAIWENFCTSEGVFYSDEIADAQEQQLYYVSSINNGQVDYSMPLEVMNIYENAIQIEVEQSQSMI